MTDDAQLAAIIRQADAWKAERDRLRAALEVIAIPPVHIPDLSEGCEACAGIARAALDGQDITDAPPRAITLTDVDLRPDHDGSGTLVMDWDNDDVAQMEAMDALRQRARDTQAERDRLRAALARLRRYWDEVQAGTVEGGALGVIEMALRDAGRLDGSGVMGGAAPEGDPRVPEASQDGSLADAGDQGEDDLFDDPTPLHECEVCDGQFGIIPVCTVTFTADDTGAVTPVRMCRACIAAVFQAMCRQWNDATAASNEAVVAICRQLGIAFAADDADLKEESMSAGGGDAGEARLIRNAARCRRCGETVESRHRHDFVTCSCGAISVDGGFDYVRRVGDPADIEELSEWSTGGDDDDPIDGYHPTLDGPAYSQTDAAPPNRGKRPPVLSAEVRQERAKARGRGLLGELQDDPSAGGADESVGARIKREGEGAQRALIDQMADGVADRTDDGYILGEPDPEDGFRPVYTQNGEHVGWSEPSGDDEPMTGAELNRWSTEQAGKHWFGGGVSDGGQELNPDTSRSPRPTGAPRQRAEFSDEQYRNHGDERSIDGSS